MAKQQKGAKKTVMVRAVALVLAALMVLSVVLSVVLGNVY
jgi:hypothetical protein